MDNYGNVVVNFPCPAIGKDHIKVPLTERSGKMLWEIFIKSPDCSLDMINEHRASFEQHKQIEVHIPQCHVDLRLSSYDTSDINQLVRLIDRK